jgi:hypothetical protein
MILGLARLVSLATPRVPAATLAPRPLR